MNETQTLRLEKIIIAGYSKKYVSEIKIFKMECTEEEFEKGLHHIRAQLVAFDTGMHPRESLVVFDSKSDAGKFLIDKFPWDNAKIFDINGCQKTKEK